METHSHGACLPISKQGCLPGMAHSLENNVSVNGVHTLKMGSDKAIKKPAKKSFRVLTGISEKPKRLYATFFHV
jgi:hypothetical protein